LTALPLTTLPVFPPQSFIKDGAPARENLSGKEITGHKEASALKESDGRAGEAGSVKDAFKPEETGSSFRKIFMEKRAEKENIDTPKSTTAPEPQQHLREQLAVKAMQARQALREGLKEMAATGDGKKPGAIRQMLAQLVEQSLKARDQVKPEKKERTAAEKRTGEHAGERVLSLQERLGQIKRKEDGLVEMKQALDRVGVEKAARQVVIIDLRDHPAEKDRSAPAKSIHDPKLAIAKTETRETKKPLETKDAYDTKVYFKPGVQPEKTDTGLRQAGGDVARARADFSSRLADVMKNEMVKHTGLVLKNNGQGEIHLVLKPESLGSVRIKLNLLDNHIVGKIIVDNNTVKQIMEENLGNLETALQQNGYQTASFDVTVAGGHQQGPGEEGSFSTFMEAGRDNAIAPVKEYEAGGLSLYADSLVNIVM
jgi:flagellar hook-length control protein FliK